MRKLPFVILGLLLALPCAARAAAVVNLWHAMRGSAKLAVEKIAESFNLSHPDVEVRVLAVPFDAMGDSLRAKIPLGTGPDLFIAPHDAVGSYAEAGMIVPLEYYADEAMRSRFIPKTVEAFGYLYPGSLWGVPAVFQNICLYYNEALVRNPPDSVSELVRVAKQFTNPNAGQYGKWGLVYETGNYYFQMIWVHAFGGKFFRQIGETPDGSPILLPLLYSGPAIDAANYVLRSIVRQNICPGNPSGPFVTTLFNSGSAMFVICGQWFRAEIDPRVRYGVARLPVVDETGRRAVPFLTSEGFYMTSCCKNQKAAFEVIEYFTGAAMGKVFSDTGGLTPANRDAYLYPSVANDPVSKVFVETSASAVVIPNAPEMSLTWGPATAAWGETLGGKDPRSAFAGRQAELMQAIEAKRGVSFRALGYDYANLASKPFYSVE